MPKPIGSIIDPPTGDTSGNGIPHIKLDTGGSSTDQSKGDDVGIPTPEIIHGFETSEPDTVRIDAAKRRGGRPKGSRNRSTTGIGTDAPKTPDSLIDLSVLLLSLHQMGAALLDIEELALDKTEAEAYADAVKELARQYPTNINPKVVAWLNFGAVVGGIYGTRFQAYRMRLKKERQNRVVEIRQPKPKQDATPATATATMSPSDIWYEPPTESIGNN